jgi:signal transduction histidine kinase
LFQNLIGNSIKFARPGVPSHIRILSQHVHDEKGEWVEIQVIDNGRGFDNTQVTEIFKAFSRLRTVREIEGFGVGLSTCRKIAIRHRGEMTARGVPGQGAVFTLRLPALEISSFLPEAARKLCESVIEAQKKGALPFFKENREARI